VTGRRQLLVDAGLVLLLLGAMVVELAVSEKPDTAITPLSLLVVGAAVAPVLLRRRHPGIAYAGCLAALIGLTSVTDIYLTIPYPSVLTAYCLAVAWGLRRALVAGLLTVPVVLGIIWFKSDHGLADWETPKNLGLVTLPLVLGVAEHQRRRVHEEETRGRVGEERLRIARDVHDVVAHAMVAINVQAGVGAHLLDRDPDRARNTLLDIKRTSGEALADLRSTLGVLRDPLDTDDVPVQPALSLRELDTLATSLGAAGLRMRLDVDPATAGLPASVDATGYRIVSEAVTNVLRHASSEEVAVRVRREDDAVVIEVEDDGVGRRTPVNGHAPGTGNGLRGMHERALAVGGTLEAGPRRHGGWRVEASLPVGAPS
jgi:signal transduction histidine kinase